MHLMTDKVLKFNAEVAQASAILNLKLLFVESINIFGSRLIFKRNSDLKMTKVLINDEKLKNMLLMTGKVSKIMAEVAKAGAN